MRVLIYKILVFALCFFSFSSLKSQDENHLNVFGSMQSIFFYEEMDFGIKKPIDTTLKDHDRSTFALQQLDLFMSKNLNDNFSVFVDIEFRLNYSSEKRWGELNLQEAWVKYESSDLFSIRAGLLYPKFNNLNEIRNKLALMPSIFRPVVYEGLLSNVFESEDFVPEKAFLQISGLYPLGIISMDYAVYVGNGESSYISNSKEIHQGELGDYISGVDAYDFKVKLIGGRIGVHKNDETFKTGISLTKDYDNKRDTTWMELKIFRPRLGDIPRWRFGMDLSFDLWIFEIESEYIHVFYDNDNLPEQVKLGQQFLYVTLVANLTDEIYSYGTYQFLNDKFMRFDSDAWVFGFGYKFNESVKLKAEWISYNQINTYPNWELQTYYNINYYMAGVSVFF